MTPRIKLRGAWLVPAALALALAACGSGSDPSSDDSDPAAPEGATYVLSVEVSGLGAGRSLALQANADGLTAPKEVTLSANGPATLHSSPTAVGFGLLVARQPDGQGCAVDPASGTLGAGMAPVQITCTDIRYHLGGQLSGLPFGSVRLRNDASGEVLVLGANGPFQFTQPLLWGQAYAISLAEQSTGLSCSLANASGTARGDVGNVLVSCSAVAGDDDSGGGGGGPVLPAAPPTPTGLAVAYGVKNYQFSWNAAAGATSYELQEDPDGAGPQPAAPIGGALAATSYSHSLAPQLLHLRLNASYRVRACNAGGCSAWSAPLVPDLTQAIGYFKASNTGAGDWFGYRVALSADGSTLAVGAIGEGGGSGAVYVFTRSTSGWAEQAYVKASNADAADNFGQSLALSADGSTLAVGAIFEDSSARTIDGDETDNSASSSGAVYVFTRNAGTWSQQAYVKASNAEADDQFGASVALSADGNTLAVGAVLEDSNATGIGGDESNNSLTASGAVYVFTRSAGTWSQQAYVKASNPDAYDRFGWSLALSADGSTLAVGTIFERSNATGIGGDQSDDSAPGAGAVYVFTRSAGNWSQQAYVKASNTGINDYFGTNVALSADGNTLAVGASGEASNATGVNPVGGESNNSASNSGAVYVFTRSAGNWSQQAYVKASNAEADDQFGASVALSADGSTLAVGAVFEDSNATGIDGDATNNLAGDSGAVYVFTRSAGTWSQQAYVKAGNTGAVDRFGNSLALSADASTLAVGAMTEDSNATGIHGDQTNNSANDAGAVYLY